MIRLAVSNIAWDTPEDESIAALLIAHGVDAIDIAPPKYFPAPAAATDADIERVRDWWSSRGIEITGMQALMFGTTGLNLFGPPDVQAAMLTHLDAICRIAAGLRAPRLVFGSPKNRDRGQLTEDQAAEAAVPFFRRLGDIAAARNVWFCIEPNPASYACNFLTHTEQAVDFVQRVAHPAIRLQIDAGTITINNENAAALIERARPIIGHIHASEPNLATLGDGGGGGTDHARLAAVLHRLMPDTLVSIEMAASKTEPHEAAVARAIDLAARHYRGRA